MVNYRKSKTKKVGLDLEFNITQHYRDAKLMEKLIEYLDCGRIKNKYSGSSVVNFRVRRLSDIAEKIIPFFDAHPIQGAKRLDYLDFRKAVEIMKVKARIYLTPEGLDPIRLIKSWRPGINKGRSN